MLLYNYHNFPAYTYVDGLLISQKSTNDQTVLKVNSEDQTGNSVFSVDIKNVENTGHHIGLWLYNKEENFWYVFAYNSNTNNINVWTLVNQKPMFTGKTFNLIKSYSLPVNFIFDEFHQFRIEIIDFIVYFYLDSDLIYSCPYSYIMYNFAIFSFNSKLEAKNIKYYPKEFETDPYKYWRISNIKNRDPTVFQKSVSIINFITNLDTISSDSTKVISASYLSEEFKDTNAFDNNPLTYTKSNSTTKNESDSWWIGYEFEEKVFIDSLSIAMRPDMESLGQDWVSFFLEGSDNKIDWYNSYKIESKIFKNDSTIHLYTREEDRYEYSIPSKLKYKFWRVNNITVDIRSLTNVLKTSASEIQFINEENILLENLENSFCSFGINPELAFDSDQSTKSESISHFLKLEDYSLGCMFDSEVNVVEFKYNYNITSDFSRWLSANIEYSPNGFDWFVKGYCDFSKTNENKIYPILNISEDLKHKFWRLSEFVSLESQGINFNSFSFSAGLRFNTLDGESSINPNKEDPNYGLYYPDHYIGPSNSFSTALNIPVNFKYSTALTRSGQNDYYTFTLFETSSVRIFSESSMDTYGYLYDSNQAQIGANDDSGGSGQFLITATLNAGRYYVMVRHYNSSSTGPYSLIIQTNSNAIGSINNKAIVYEFSKKEYVNKVKFVSSKDPMYCKLESSDDSSTWNFEGYLNFTNPVKLDNLNHFELYRETTNFFDYFGNTNLGFIENYSFKESLITFNSKYLNPEITNLNIYNPDSNGVVKGQVLELNVPVIREVAIYDRRTRQLIAITWSNEEGFYEFKNLNSSKTYYVHAIDSNKIYNAVTKDMLELLK